MDISEFEPILWETYRYAQYIFMPWTYQETPATSGACFLRIDTKTNLDFYIDVSSSKTGSIGWTLFLPY